MACRTFKPYPSAWTAETLARRLLDFVVVDPFQANKGHRVIQSFKEKGEADAWLLSQQEADPTGYDGCLVVPRSEALAHYVQP